MSKLTPEAQAERTRKFRETIAARGGDRGYRNTDDDWNTKFDRLVAREAAEAEAEVAGCERVQVPDSFVARAAPLGSTLNGLEYRVGVRPRARGAQ
jgi:hypothetical protein